VQGRRLLVLLGGGGGGGLLLVVAPVVVLAGLALLLGGSLAGLDSFGLARVRLLVVGAGVGARRGGLLVLER